MGSERAGGYVTRLVMGVNEPTGMVVLDIVGDESV